MKNSLKNCQDDIWWILPMYSLLRVSLYYYNSLNACHFLQFLYHFTFLIRWINLYLCISVSTISLSFYFFKQVNKPLPMHISFYNILIILLFLYKGINLFLCILVSTRSLSFIFITFNRWNSFHSTFSLELVLISRNVKNALNYTYLKFSCLSAPKQSGPSMWSQNYTWRNAEISYAESID